MEVSISLSDDHITPYMAVLSALPLIQSYVD